MEEETSIDASTDLVATHFFVYKGKQFPFNIILFKCFSEYFQKNEQLFEGKQSVALIDESEPNSDYSESSINDFINFCQHQKITLNKSNALSLNKLAKRFVVSSLIKATNKYISTHQKDVALDLLLLTQEDEDISNQEYEDMVSDNLSEYFQDNRLLSLHLPVLHRIVTKYAQKNPFNSNNNQAERSEFIEFLFKCLDKFGRLGSALFEHIDIGGMSGTFLPRLLKDYSEKFDFHFINDQQLRTVYDLEGEIIKKLNEPKDAIEKEIHSLKQKLDDLEAENKRLKAEIDQMSKNKDSQIQLILQKQEEMKTEYERAIIEAESRFTRQLSQLKDQISQLSQKEAQKEESPGQLDNQIVESRHSKASCMFLNESDPKGVISMLKNSVTLSAAGFPGPKSPVTNLTKYDKSEFYNAGLNTPTSESQAYITFDFGPTNKIDLHSYLIRSNQWGPSMNGHPKTWRIEGSNDYSNWIPLDKRINDASLNGTYKQNHFVCQYSHNGDQNNRYRYIRYIQQDSWWNGNPYHVYLTYFELYGDVFGNY